MLIKCVEGVLVPFPAATGAAATSLFTSTPSSAAATRNFTLQSILVGLDILILSMTPLVPGCPHMMGPNAKIFSFSAYTTFPTASLSNLLPTSPSLPPTRSARELTTSCSSKMLVVSSVVMAGKQESPGYRVNGVLVGKVNRVC